jgi:hypothetical protein
VVGVDSFAAEVVGIVLEDLGGDLDRVFDALAAKGVAIDTDCVAVAAGGVAVLASFADCFPFTTLFFLVAAVFAVCARFFVIVDDAFGGFNTGVDVVSVAAAGVATAAGVAASALLFERVRFC